MIPVEGNMQSLTSKQVFKKRWLKYEAGFYFLIETQNTSYSMYTLRIYNN